ncbi:MAG TPA: S-layer homology domain-containing protein [Clostridiaceae bacterium]|nr:S-layer homology domain-containing protein [Clostridiaceae bacterium]
MKLKIITKGNATVHNWYILDDNSNIKVTVLGRLAGADVSGYKESNFTDVKNNAYYMGYIEWARENGIVNGTGNDKFAPDEPVTREQMAVIMQRYAKAIGFTFPKVHEEKVFTDSEKINAYARETVKQMQTAGLLNGKSGNIFDPLNTATRAEVSAILHRFVELMISSDAK